MPPISRWYPKLFVAGCDMGVLAAASAVGTLASGLGSLFGGGRKSSGVPDYAKIRKRAEAAGFNPAFALSQGGFSAPVSGPTFGERLADAGSSISNGADALARMKAQETELDQRERELDLRERELGRQRSVSLFSDPGSRVPREPVEDLGGAPAVGISLAKPKARPGPSSETVPVYNQSGGLIQLDKKTADRLGIVPFGTMMQEDTEALFGDVASEALLVPHLPNIPQTYFGEGWTSARPLKDRRFYWPDDAFANGGKGAQKPY